MTETDEGNPTGESPVWQRLATSQKRVLRGRTTGNGKESCEA